MTSPFRHEGRVALVTGSSRGIGFSVAAALFQAGARIVLHGRDTTSLHAAVDELARPPGEVDFCVADLATETGAIALAEDVKRRFGRIDILVNNAGFNLRRNLSALSTKDWDLTLRLNLSSYLILAQAFAPAMVASGWGRIINIGSIMSLVARAGIPAYTTAKHGVAGLTKALAAELGASGVTANGVAPGYIATRGTESLRSNPKFLAMIENRVPLGRWGNPDEIAGAVVYLASDAASYVNGHMLVVDGGMTATI